MSEPAILRWPLPGRTTVEGALVSCPTCGAEDRLILCMDLDDHTEGPSYMSCNRGHLWAEDLFPRRIAAEFLDEMLQLNPALLGRLDDLREAMDRKEQGGGYAAV